MIETNIPFEIHITTENFAVSRQEEFIDFCLSHQAKPLLIELAKGDHVHQPMFSKVIHINNPGDVLATAAEFSTSLGNAGFQASRMKIEVPADHAGTVTDLSTGFSKYYECHLKIRLNRLEDLLVLCEQHKVHLSLNALKDAEYTRFITLREFGTKDIFEQRVKLLAVALEQGGWPVIKQQAEYCIYDNNNLLDKGWLPQ